LPQIQLMVDRENKELSIYLFTKITNLA